MALIRNAVLLVAALSLAACSQTGGTAGALLSALRPAKAAAGPDPASLSRTDIVSAGIPVMRARLPARGADFLIVQRESRGDIATFVSADGASFTFRSGILIETRGLGGDLMSSAAPTPGQIGSLSGHTRSYFQMGADDKTERRDYTCTPEDRGSQTVEIYGKAFATRQIAEVCQRPEGRITNDFWLQGGQVRKSRQWVSPTVGYAEFDRVTD